MNGYLFSRQVEQLAGYDGETCLRAANKRNQFLIWSSIYLPGWKDGGVGGDASQGPPLKAHNGRDQVVGDHLEHLLRFTRLPRRRVPFAWNVVIKSNR